MKQFIWLTDIVPKASINCSQDFVPWDKVIPFNIYLRAVTMKRWIQRRQSLHLTTQNFINFLTFFRKCAKYLGWLQPFRDWRLPMTGPWHLSPNECGWMKCKIKLWGLKHIRTYHQIQTTATVWRGCDETKLLMVPGKYYNSPSDFIHLFYVPTWQF